LESSVIKFFQYFGLSLFLNTILNNPTDPGVNLDSSLTTSFNNSKFNWNLIGISPWLLVNSKIINKFMIVSLYDNNIYLPLYNRLRILTSYYEDYEKGF